MKSKLRAEIAGTTGLYIGEQLAVWAFTVTDEKGQVTKASGVLAKPAPGGTLVAQMALTAFNEVLRRYGSDVIEIRTKVLREDKSKLYRLEKSYLSNSWLHQLALDSYTLWKNSGCPRLVYVKPVAARRVGAEAYREAQTALSRAQGLRDSTKHNLRTRPGEKAKRKSRLIHRTQEDGDVYILAPVKKRKFAPGVQNPYRSKKKLGKRGHKKPDVKVIKLTKDEIQDVLSRHSGDHKF